MATQRPSLAQRWEATARRYQIGQVEQNVVDYGAIGGAEGRMANDGSKRGAWRGVLRWDVGGGWRGKQFFPVEEGDE